VDFLGKVSKLSRILSYPFYFRALMKGAAAGVEHERMLGPLTLRTIVDVGANRGQFALVCRAKFPDARIVAFEPLRDAGTVFRSVFAVDGSTSLHEVALGVERTQARMHVSAADDSSSLLPIGQRQEALFPGTAESHTVDVNVVPLDAIVSASEIESPALLKIDVQGFELEVLRGCRSLLPQFDYVYVECSFVELYDNQAMAHEVIAWLAERGFRLGGVHNLTMSRSGIAVQADFLFSRN
jgi:FkbM family methyltransferase